MSARPTIVLLVDPDPRARALLGAQLRSKEFELLEAGDGPTALETVRRAGGPLVVVTELYLPTGEDDCLIHAIRRDRANRRTRVIAHTYRSLASDREWAMRAGADAYLIKPTRVQRMRYVIGRLATERAPSSASALTSSSAIVRRDSLEAALADIERGRLSGTSCIVFGREWWEHLDSVQRATFRRRAKTAHVSLRSDSMLGQHFVEVRGPSRDEPGLSTERPESPYRR